MYWLYNRTGEKWLLDLATKIDRNTANWRQASNLPNWHNVNIAQCFRGPATYWLQSKNAADRDATYNDFSLIRNRYGQVPGGMWGGDENSRKGYDDPRQAVETCGMVEQMTSNQLLLRFTGDNKWADNCEDVAFNTFPAAFMPDYKSLRYLTAPNMVLNDGKNHAPGIDNAGPFLMMNPFSSRCCQHNHAAGWVYYAENAWMATPDNGLAAQFYTAGTVTARVGNGTAVSITAETKYPFEEAINFSIAAPHAVAFPLWLRMPAWCKNPAVYVNGKQVEISVNQSSYIVLKGNWKAGDKIQLLLPMQLQLRQWAANKNSVSINYGPLTFSVDIKETYKKENSRESAQHDAKWQENADTEKWPSYEISAASPWNYGLLLTNEPLEKQFTITRNAWPADDNPFTNAAAPITFTTKGKQIPSWTIDQYGLCGLLPVSPVHTTEPVADIKLVPMGGARLRISAFPVVER